MLPFVTSAASDVYVRTIASQANLCFFSATGFLPVLLNLLHVSTAQWHTSCSFCVNRWVLWVLVSSGLEEREHELG